MISYNGTPNNGGSFYFVLVTLFTMQKNYNHEFVNTLQIKYSENRAQAQ